MIHHHLGSSILPLKVKLKQTAYNTLLAQAHWLIQLWQHKLMFMKSRIIYKSQPVTKRNIGPIKDGKWESNLAPNTLLKKKNVKEEKP